MRPGAWRRDPSPHQGVENRKGEVDLAPSATPWRPARRAFAGRRAACAPRRALGDLDPVLEAENGRERVVELGRPGVEQCRPPCRRVRRRAALERADAQLGDLDERRSSQRGGPYVLNRPGGEGGELPEEVAAVIRHVVAAMSKGLAVTVTPHAMAVSTQQAADLLRVSRPTLVRHLESGDIAFERVASHRRLRLTDVLDFRERRRSEQYECLAETSVAIDDEHDLADSLEQLRNVRRRQQASRRRTPVRPKRHDS